MSSEEIAQAAADLATVEQLHARILEWEDSYDRLAGAFDLRMAVDECHAALAGYAGSYYDVVMGDMAAQADYWRLQAADVLLDLHAAQAAALALRDALIRWVDADGTHGFSEEDERLAELAQALTSVDCRPGASLLAELAAARERVVGLERQIEQAREILSALENETLVEAANDLVREEQTSNEAYHKIHALYWKETMPELALARAIVAALRMHHDAGGEVWHSIDADLAAYDAAVKGRAE